MKEDMREIINSFQSFATSAAGLLNIKTREDCERAEELLEAIFEISEDSTDDPMNPLIDLLSDAIDRYESQDRRVIQFEKDVAALNPRISALRLLMDQHGLKAKDLKEEIGSPTLISLILNGERNLTVAHIEKLSARFGVEPGMFFR